MLGYLIWLVMRTCIKCGQIKDDSLFVFDTTRRVYKNTCKDCRRKYLKEYRLNIKNGGKSKVVKQSTLKMGIALPQPKIVIKNPRKHNSEISPQKRYGNENYPTEEDWRIHKREYEKKWKNKDKSRRIASSIRCKLWELLTGQRKHYKFREMLGCDDTFLRKHLESMFKDGMTWDNYGIDGWHVDHIIPLCSFDLKDPQQHLLCTHWSNLQPLWWWENLSKGGKII